jgi:hypothetical protein
MQASAMSYVMQGRQAWPGTLEDPCSYSLVVTPLFTYTPYRSYKGGGAWAEPRQEGRQIVLWVGVENMMDWDGLKSTFGGGGGLM